MPGTVSVRLWHVEEDDWIGGNLLCPDIKESTSESTSSILTEGPEAVGGSNKVKKEL